MKTRARVGHDVPRRVLLGSAGIAAASSMLSGCGSLGPPPLKPPNPADDPAILTNILALKFQTMAAYDFARSGKHLSSEEDEMAASFLADHRQHAEALTRSISRLGGTPPEQRPLAAYGFSSAILATRQDTLSFLIDTEQGMTLAHLGSVPALSDKDLAKGQAGLLAVTAMHWASWRSALGEPPVPAPFLG